MDGLKTIISKCKCGVFLSVNEYRDYYEKISDAIDEIEDRDDKIPDNIKEGMISSGNIYRLQFYPNTPIGHYVCHDYTLEGVIAQALEILEEIN